MPTISEDSLALLLVHLVREHVKIRSLVRRGYCRATLLHYTQLIRQLVRSGCVERDLLRELFRHERQHQGGAL